MEDDFTGNNKIKPTKVTLTLILNYQYQILQELIILQNVMLIICKGMNIYLIISNMLYILSISRNDTKNDKKKPFILIINSNNEIDNLIKENIKELLLANNNNGSNLNLPYNINNLLSEKRELIYKEMYYSGGILSISSRVLIVDILNNIINLNNVTGLLIMNSDTLIEQPFNNMVFIIDYYKKKNSWGFIKCISENVNNFTNIEQPLRTCSKNFHIDKFLIYPRFHETIINDLNNNSSNNDDGNNGSLIEVKIQPTELMLTLQHALSDLLNKCINELIISVKNLKNLDPSLNFINDFQEEKTILIQTRHHSDNLDPELKDKIKNSIKLNYLNDNFIKYLNMKLEPFAHLLSRTSKNLLKDIAQLRSFIFQLYSTDSVQFYRYLKQVMDFHKENQQQSLWLVTQEANTIITTAKNRVVGKNNSNNKYNLELQPKWIQLKKIISECQEDKLTKNNDSPILIMCQQDSTIEQLQKVISNKDLRKFMLRKLAHVINEQKQKENINKYYTVVRDNKDITLSTTFTKNPINLQNRLRDDVNKRRRVRTDDAVERVEKLWNMDGDGDINISNVTLESINKEINKKTEIEEQENEESIENDTPVAKTEIMDGIEEKGEDEIDLAVEEIAQISFLKPDNSLFLCRYGSMESKTILESVQPKYVILYEPNLEFIRQLDLYKQVHHNTKIYLLYYRDTIEEQHHLTTLKREKKTFVKLLKERNTIPKFFHDYNLVNEKVDEDVIAGDISAFENIVKQKNFRNASVKNNGVNNKSGYNGGGTVIVDSREFNAPLPGLLSRFGQCVVKPAFLTVGDYILTPTIAVERKSIPDLTASLKNGRLIKQLRQMGKHYERVVLLIEWQFNERFQLQDQGDFGIMERLCDVILKVPFVRVIWSSSPLQTVNIFLSLKEGQNEPDLDDSIVKGKGIKLNKLPIVQNKLFLDDDDEDEIIKTPNKQDIQNNELKEINEEEDDDDEDETSIDIKDIIFNLVELSQLQAFNIVNHFKNWDSLIQNLDELDKFIEGDDEMLLKVKEKIHSITE
ncbi:hypothetical protein ACO0SA_004362 [Hanseniaspora valbyensis]